MRKKILTLFTGRGTLLQPAALEYLMHQANPDKLAQDLLKNMTEGRLILTVEDIREMTAALRPNGDGGNSPVDTGPATGNNAEEAGDGVSPPGHTGITDAARTAEVISKRPKRPVPGLEIVKDVTGNSTCVGEINDFVKYFNDRHVRLKRMIRLRRELVGATPLNSLRARRHEREVKTIGMVRDIRRTQKGRMLAEIEDEDGSIALLLPEDTPKTRVNLVKDEVIGVIGSLGKDGDIIYAETIIRPDIPLLRESHRASEPICAGFISDIHVGSKTFLPNEWKRFIAWLRGTDSRHQDYARKLKYLVVSGDLVDGIGIYPDHEEDLEIKDVYEQYRYLSEMLKEIPDSIQLIVLPGNHDAVRPAEPQPTFPDEITKLFDSHIKFVGNPCQFRLEGVEILAYHGMSIADFISSIPNLSFNTPLEVMKEMLRRRHLAPIFGDKTPLAPESRDWMVIDTVPDIFVTGHVHGVGMENYHGVVLINSSAWQSQTDYQRMMNFQPQPARVPVVDLQTLSWRIIPFTG